MSVAKKKKLDLSMPSARAEDQPATRKMLSLVRDELKSDIRALDQKMESRFQSLDSKFQAIESKFQGIDSKFQSIESRFQGVDSRLARMELLFEEQNANNRIVLEGLQALWQRQDRLESRL